MIVFAFLKILGFLTFSISARLHALYWSALFGNAVVVVAAFAATAIMARLDHRAFGYYGPVSYTHLDVYKRQMRDKTECRQGRRMKW